MTSVCGFDLHDKYSKYLIVLMNPLEGELFPFLVLLCSKWRGPSHRRAVPARAGSRYVSALQQAPGVCGPVLINLVITGYQQNEECSETGLVRYITKCNLLIRLLQQTFSNAYL